MKRRYFAMRLLALGILLSGCGRSNNPYTDIVMLTETPPQTECSQIGGSYFVEIWDCTSFKENIVLDNDMKYGTAYYINNQSTPVTLTIKGEDIDETITIPSLKGQGVLWQNTKPIGSPDQNYVLSITSTDNDPLYGYLAWASSDGQMNIKEWSENSPCHKTFVYQDTIVPEENVFTTSLTLADTQYRGVVSYTNKQDVPALIHVVGNDGIDKRFEVPAFETNDIDFEKIGDGIQTYTVTITCNTPHTLNGFLSIFRLDVPRET